MSSHTDKSAIPEVNDHIEAVEVPDWVDDVYVSRNHNCTKVDGQTMSFSGGNIIKKITRKGHGEYPLPFSIVTCHYVGTLAADGTEFDNSYAREEPFKFMLGDKEVIKAWEIGIASMRVGEEAIFTCKADYCYGKIGNPPSVPEDADLIFRIELLGVERGCKKIKDGLGKIFVKRGLGMNVPTHGTLCHIRIQGRIGNEDGQIFLDEWEDPLLVRIDDVYLPKGLEYALCSMKPEEISLFEVEPAICGNGFEPLRHKVKIPKDINLYYKIELVEMEPLPETWAMKPLDKVEEARRLKNAGNDFFKVEQYERAYIRYKHALEYFEFDDVKAMEGEEVQHVNDIKVICLNNMQIVMMKDKDYKNALIFANDCLQIQPTHLKSYYRRAQALLYTNETEAALKDIHAALEMMENNVVTVAETMKRDFLKLKDYGNAKLKQEHSKAKKVWSKAFAAAYASDVTAKDE